MKKGPTAKTLWLGLGFIVLGLTGVYLITGGGPRPVPFSGWGGGGIYDKGSYVSNGERIYYLGIGIDGKRIGMRGGPPWIYGMGGSCVNCHGPDGRGGFPVMMGTEVPSDIRFSSLMTGEHDQGGEGAGGHRYTEEDIRRAITDGVEPDGEHLDPTMPRYDMGDEDLNDLIGFLKILD